MLEFYISQERDFFGFITHIRAEYNTWLGTEGQSEFLAVSMKGTLIDTLQEVHSYKCVHSNLSLKLVSSNPPSSGSRFRRHSLQLLQSTQF